MDDAVGAAVVERFLSPLPDEAAPCGPDLEYDPAFLELNQAAAGKPETQWAAAEPPNWREVRTQAEALFERTRDLRVAVLWARAAVNQDGFAALPQGLRLLHGLMAGFWDTLHPLPDPDDHDPYARMNALAVLPQPDGLIGDLRQAVLFRQRGVGELRVRTIEVALGLLPARSDETAIAQPQLEQMLADALGEEPALRAQVQAAIERTKALIALLNERVGIENAVDLKPLYSLLNAIAGVLPAPPAADEAAEGEADDETGSPAEGGGRAAAPRKGLAGSVDSREDAIRAIDMVCAYLERAEPTSPAPLLLRRARRLINRNFLQLMKELAPDALNEVARVMGVDPETVQLDDAS
jgi:type VI secretion system protein ImpA